MIINVYIGKCNDTLGWQVNGVIVYPEIEYDVTQLYDTLLFLMEGCSCCDIVTNNPIVLQATETIAHVKGHNLRWYKCKGDSCLPIVARALAYKPYAKVLHYLGNKEYEGDDL